MPKYLLGKPSDTLNGALAKRLPWRLRQRISQTMLRTDRRLPRPLRAARAAHGFLQDHPTLSDGLLSRLEPRRDRGPTRRSSASTATGWRSWTDRSDEVDLIVWCTGYRMDLPFLDPALLAGGADTLPLYRRFSTSTRPGLMLRRADAVDRCRAARGRGAGQADRGAPGRRVRAARRRSEQRADLRAAELRAAPQRWGQRRPAMRIDFDGYLAELAREMTAGTRRARSGAASSVGARR